MLMKRQGHHIRIHLPHIPAGIHSANNYFQHFILKNEKDKGIWSSKLDSKYNFPAKRGMHL